VIQLSGEAAALATALLWSFTSMFFSFSGKRIGSAAVNRGRLLLASLMYAATHLWLYGSPLPLATDGVRLGWLALSAVLGLVLGDSALFQAFVLVGPRIAMLMMAMVPIVSTVLAWLLLGQTMTGTELLGIAVTVCGIAYVVSEPAAEGAHGPSKRDDGYKLGIALGLAGAVGQATGLIAAERGLVGGYPALSASFVRMLVAGAILWSLAAFRGQLGPAIRSWRDRPALGSLAAGSVVGPFFGVTLSLYAIQHTRVGLAATLMALTPVFLIPLGRVAYGEKVSRRGVVGTLLAFVGVALILLPG